MEGGGRRDAIQSAPSQPNRQPLSQQASQPVSQPASQPVSQPAAGPRSAEQEKQQAEQHTNEVPFALVSNSFAHFSRASCRAFLV